MLNGRWTERCFAQNVHPLEGDIPLRADLFGAVIAKDGRGLYPIGMFEVCGGVTVYPPQTLNPAEEDAMLAAAAGLSGMWDKEGVLTLRFAKQRDGSEFALSGADEAMSFEAENLLLLRGLWDGEGAAFLKPGGEIPELTELTVAGASFEGELHHADSLLGTLLKLPVQARAGMTGWFETFLRHDG
jgi:hypothetical protein